MMSFLWRYSKGNVGSLLMFTALSLVQGAVQLFGLTREMKNIVDLGIGANDTAYLMGSGARMLGYAALVAACGAAIAYMGASIACKVRKDITRDCYRKIVSLSSQDVAHFGEASLITRTITDTENIQRLLGYVLSNCLLAPVIIVLMLGSLFTGDRDIFLIEATAVICSIAIMLLLMVRARGHFPTLQKSIDHLNLLTQEKIDGVRTIRAFGREDFEASRGEEANAQAFHADIAANRPLKFVSPVILSIMNLSMVLVYWVGASKAQARLVELSTLLLTIQYVNSLIPALNAMPIVVNMIPGAEVGVTRIKELIDYEGCGIDETKVDSALRPSADEPALAFEDVSFGYSGRGETLRGLSFVIDRGTRVGVVGATGSGKSTLLALICGLFQPQGGSILVGGAPMERLGKEARTSFFSYVPQKAMVFKDSVAANIRAYNDDIDDETVRRASESAVFDEVVGVLENGLETQMAQGGMNLSGGQRKRLSLARGLAKDAEVFVLDDPFAALDAVTEKKARTRTLAALEGKTVIMAATRFSTIADFDQIIVMRHGRIVDIGTHQELLDRCEEYAETCRTQSYLERK